MAHRTNVIQVTQNIPSTNMRDKVQDLVCGKNLNRTESRHLLMKEGGNLYFCSKTCREQFISGQTKLETGSQFPREFPKVA